MILTRISCPKFFRATVIFCSLFSGHAVLADAQFVEGCQAVRGTAFLAMSGRQFDNNIAKTIQEVGISEGVPDNVNRIRLEIVQEAYRYPLKFTDDGRLDAVTEFADRLYENCIYWFDDGTSSTVGRGATN